MKNLIFLIVVAVLALTVLLFIYNPGILDKIWLWVVGLIGTIVALIRNGIEGLKSLLRDEEDKKQPAATASSALISQKTTSLPPSVAVPEMAIDANRYQSRIKELEEQIVVLEGKLKNSRTFDRYVGTTLTVLRYFDDGDTTLGLLFIDDTFFCYTLEDTYNAVKIQGETRIPQGTYMLGFNRVLTPLTQKYRDTRTWFEYHLHVKDVPGYESIYIHSGSTSQHTEGCLLVADSILSSDKERAIFNSRVTFERLYKKLKPIIDAEQPVRIRYFDEDWFERVRIKQIVA